MAPPDQNREFPFFKITAKRTMSQKNDHDFRDQHKILVLEMLTNPCEGLVTKILLHSVIKKNQIDNIDRSRGSFERNIV